MSYFEDGVIKENAHIYKVKICFHHTDAGGVVYHGRYLNIAEEARGAFLRKINCKGAGIFTDDKSNKLAFALRKCETDYLYPAMLENTVEIKTNLLELKKASMTILQDFFVNNKKTTSIKIKMACLNIENGRPSAIPTQITEKLKDFIQTEK